MVQYVFSFFSSLNKNSHPGDIAHGVALGLLLAIMPKNNLLWPALFVFTIFIRINKGAFFLSLIFLGFLAHFGQIRFLFLSFVQIKHLKHGLVYGYYNILQLHKLFPPNLCLFRLFGEYKLEEKNVKIKLEIY
ncbi:MAG: hypothetical protein P1P64_08515 [Treponemataceae bacterium]